MLMHMEYL